MLNLETPNLNVNDIDVENVTIMALMIDISGSMESYTPDMQKALAEFKDSLLNSKQADEILISKIEFDDTITQQGYAPVSAFDTSYRTGNTTHLYDAIISTVKNQEDYETDLKASGTRVKTLFGIFTDGADYTSNASLADAKAAIGRLMAQEKTVVFIAFGSEGRTEAAKLGFPSSRVLDVSASGAELRKAFNCLSKSTSSFSQSSSALPTTQNFFTI